MAEKKKIYVLTCSMKGHLMPNVKLAEYLATFPNIEVTFMTDRQDVSPLPKPPVKLSLPSPEEVSPTAIEAIEKIFAEVALHPKANETRWTVYLMTRMYFTGTKDDPRGPAEIYFGTMAAYAQKVMLAEKPDLLITEQHFDINDCMNPFVTKHGIKWVKISNPGRPDPCLDPSMLIKAFLPNICALLAFVGRLGPFQAAAEKAGGFTAEDRKATKTPILTMLPGSKVLVDFPSAPHELYVGPFVTLPGMAAKQPVSHPALDFIGAAGTDPVIYVAFGTLVILNPKIVDALVKGLNEVKCKVLWAIPEAQQTLLPPGLTGPKWMIDKFVPQAHVLMRSEVKVFISHCGCSSTHEAMAAGIPMIGIPFLGDQSDWARDITNYVKSGLTLDKTKATPKQVTDAVNKVLTDPTFAENAVKISKKIETSESFADEVPPGDIGVAAAARVAFEILNGRDILADRQAAIEAAKPPEPEKRKGGCALL